MIRGRSRGSRIPVNARLFSRAAGAVLVLSTICYTKEELDDLIEQLRAFIIQHKAVRASAGPNRLNPSIVRPTKLSVENRVLMTLMFLTRYPEYHVSLHIASCALINAVFLFLNRRWVECSVYRNPLLAVKCIT